MQQREMIFVSIKKGDPNINAQGVVQAVHAS